MQSYGHTPGRYPKTPVTPQNTLAHKESCCTPFPQQIVTALNMVTNHQYSDTLSPTLNIKTLTLQTRAIYWHRHMKHPQVPRDDAQSNPNIGHPHPIPRTQPQAVYPPPTQQSPHLPHSQGPSTGPVEMGTGQGSRFSRLIPKHSCRDLWPDWRPYFQSWLFPPGLARIPPPPSLISPQSSRIKWVVKTSRPGLYPVHSMTGHKCPQTPHVQSTGGCIMTARPASGVGSSP